MIENQIDSIYRRFEYLYSSPKQNQTIRMKRGMDKRESCSVINHKGKKAILNRFHLFWNYLKQITYVHLFQSHLYLSFPCITE
ncbi:unnamed protein product [Schistosoma guineensis]|nr:unnamed protein product [Schistosoma guineensis]